MVGESICLYVDLAILYNSDVTTTDREHHLNPYLFANQVPATMDDVLYRLQTLLSAASM